MIKELKWSRNIPGWDRRCSSSMCKHTAHKKGWCWDREWGW